MRHRKHTFKIGRSGAHRKALLANQVCSLIEEGEIKTTVVKAKETRRLADRMITLGKKATLHHRRLAISRLRKKNAVAKLFEEIAPKYANRDGGYTRIIRLGNRIGDNAEICILQWVEADSAGKPVKKKADDKKKTAKTEKKETAVEEKPKADEKKEKPATDVKEEKKKASGKEEDSPSEAKGDEKEAAKKS